MTFDFDRKVVITDDLRECPILMVGLNGKEYSLEDVTNAITDEGGECMVMWQDDSSELPFIVTQLIYPAIH